MINFLKQIFDKKVMDSKNNKTEPSKPTNVVNKKKTIFTTRNLAELQSDYIEKYLKEKINL